MVRIDDPHTFTMAERDGRRVASLPEGDQARGGGGSCWSVTLVGISSMPEATRSVARRSGCLRASSSAVALVHEAIVAHWPDDE